MRAKKIIPMLILTIAITGVLLLQVSVGDIVSTISGIPAHYVIIGFFIYALSYVFRALRFRVLLRGELGLKDIFPIVCIHNLVNIILPARTGELSYVYLIRKKGISSADGIATLITARIFDLIAILLVLLLSVLNLSIIIPGLTVIIIACILAVFGFFIFLIYFNRRFVNTVYGIFNRFSLTRFKLMRFLLRKLEETSESLMDIKSKRIIFFNFIFSIAIWLLVYASSYILILGMPIELGFWGIVFISAAITLAYVLPIHSFAGFGTIEAFWTAAAIAIGITMEVAIVSSFTLHIVSLVYFFIIGMFGLLIRHVS
ncbi:MAG: flippase-like domain-containing protein [Candidatus Aenigmarchaeota archaeon]|nr:flippase-like domain-containing protein [Candidatus Aenigmarchaeota archaeon]